MGELSTSACRPNRRSDKVAVDPTRVVSDEEMYEPKPFPGAVLGRTGSIREAADAIFWLW